MNQPRLNATALDVNCQDDGRASVRVNVTCHSPDDVDDVIEWLKLAQDVMVKWDAIRGDLK